MDDSLLSGLSDSHCHLHTGFSLELGLESIGEALRGNELRALALMSTNHLDIDVVDELSRMFQPLVFPFFGIHPWYSHLFAAGALVGKVDKASHYVGVLYPEPTAELLSVLPEPLSLAEHLDKIRSILRRCRQEYLEAGDGVGVGVGVGEIGLDKPFRIPTNGYYGNSTSSDFKVSLSPCRVKMDHQVEIFKAQLEIAKEFDLPVSIHCVKGHGILYDICGSFQDIKIILHSYSGSIDQAKMWIKRGKKNNSVFFSISNGINGASNKTEALLQLLDILPDNCILIETDISIDKSIPDGSHKFHLLEIFQKICKYKNWSQAEGINILKRNWINVTQPSRI